MLYVFEHIKTGAHAPLLLSIIVVYLVIYDYSIISVTTPDPTVLPPSLIAKRSPSSIATGVISSISITTVSYTHLNTLVTEYYYIH